MPPRSHASRGVYFSEPMITDNTDTCSYKARNGSDRLYPPPYHSRYMLLVMLREELEKVVNSNSIREGKTILDYGCGDKPYEPLFAKRFKRYLGADLPGNKRADMVVGPSGELPVQDGTVDCVLSSQVLEHVKEPRSYLAEACRVLKKDGTLVLSTHGMWQYHPDPEDYWRWTAKGLELEIQRSGFQVMSLHSIMGRASYALQLWQDATGRLVPRFVRPFYYASFQFLIWAIEKLRHGRYRSDGCIYVVVARRR